MKTTIRRQFASLEELEDDDSNSGIVASMGYNSAKELWNANPKYITAGKEPEELSRKDYAEESEE